MSKHTSTVSLVIACVAAAVILGPAPAWGWAGEDSLPPPEDVPLLIPDDYDPEVPAPLLILLHGYGTTGPWMEDGLVEFANHANTRGYFYSLPTGNVDSTGAWYWNATDACCDFDGANPDHVGYLVSLIDYLEATYSIDPRRIHLFGVSNGGFMCHRMACEIPDRLASVVSNVGATWLDPAQCPANGVVHVAQIHGTSDRVVRYTGGELSGVPYPGAEETVAQWVDKLACDPVGVEDPEPLDFDASVPGSETIITRYEDCPPGASVELWKVVGAAHVMTFNDAGRTAIFDYFDTHRAPCPGDVDGSDDVGFGDILAIIGAWGPCGVPCPEDLSGNGSVDFADILAVIAAWGPCS
jgi:polyhydroxybutyrate depolymerase